MDDDMSVATTMTDPRSYRPAATPDGDPIAYPCGCVLARMPPFGVLRSVCKCRTHRAGARDPAGLDGAYYAELGVIDAEGRQLPTAHVAELTEALGPLPGGHGRFPGREDLPGIAVEIGCGASPYCRAILDAGWFYIGVERSRWAVEFMRTICPLPHGGIHEGPFEEMEEQPHSGLILAAHVLEHMDDAPGAIDKCARILAPGGELWVVVPDDSDPFNPDHLWLFTPETLAACLAGAGLTVEALEVRRYVAHERFIYMRARKP
jgi:SAM-dependent methyltransferase